MSQAAARNGSNGRALPRGDRPWRRTRRGQTLILALAVMFLLVSLGAVFAITIARNLGRIQTARGMTRADALAYAGIEYVRQQILSSEEGADWRPEPTELLWRTSGGNTGAHLRDPDYPWLSQELVDPWVRYNSRDGRFLVRVSFRPRFTDGSGDEVPDRFDPNTLYLHIESIGRPGIVDEFDPTTLRDIDAEDFSPDDIMGEWRRLEAWIPLGLINQLWWVTNRSNRRGPAVLGVPPFPDPTGTGAALTFDSEYFGGITVNSDLAWIGENTVRLMPARGESVQVRGNFLHRAAGAFPALVRVLREADTPGDPAVPEIDRQDDTVRELVEEVIQGPSGTGGYSPMPWFDGRSLYADGAYVRAPGAVEGGRSIRGPQVASLDERAASSGMSRYEALTRESGIVANVTFGGETRTVNLGLYGLGPHFGGGIYIDNFTDIQYPSDRSSVIDEWLQRGSGDAGLTGWTGFQYIPSVRSRGAAHPILEAVFLPPGAHPAVPNGGIRFTRFDRDVRGHNFGDAVGRTRLFYDLVGDPADLNLVPVGQTHYLPYPENGVIYTEGSVRVRGEIGSEGPLTLVSGGTIYIEGNLIRPDDRPNAYLALLARDYVCLNPTAFYRFNPSDDVVLHADFSEPGRRPTSFRYTIAEGSHLQISTEHAEDEGTGYFLHLRHSAGWQDTSSRTDVSLLRGTDRFDFGTSDPGAPGSGDPNFFYHFLFFPPEELPFLPWSVSNHQSRSGGGQNYERKTFAMPLATDAGDTVSLRWLVESLASPDWPTTGSQPYWLSRAALIPASGPLKVRIDAVVYAQEGSWFVIPPPWFNTHPEDTRALFEARADADMSVLRAPGTYPNNSTHYPFAGEPLNIEIELRGAITENMPVDVTERLRWTERLWRPEQNGNGEDYRPTIRYLYEQNLRRYARVRFMDTGAEEVVYVGPDPALYPGLAHTPPPGTPTLAEAVAEAQGRDTYLTTLPLFPYLPPGTVVYQGNPR